MLGSSRIIRGDNYRECCLLGSISSMWIHYSYGIYQIIREAILNMELYSFRLLIKISRSLSIIKACTLRTKHLQGISLDYYKIKELRLEIYLLSNNFMIIITIMNLLRSNCREQLKL